MKSTFEEYVSVLTIISKKFDSQIFEWLNEKYELTDLKNNLRYFVTTTYNFV